MPELAGFCVWVFDFGNEELLCCILRAASRSRAAVLAGMWRRMGLEDLAGGEGDGKSKRGDFLGSGEVCWEKKQTLLQRLEDDFRA